MSISSGRNSSNSRSFVPGRGNPNRMKFLYLVNILALCGVTLAALAAAGMMLLRQMQTQEENAELEAELEALQGENKTLYTAEELEEQVQIAREEGAETERNQLLMQIQSDMQSGTSTASMLRSLFADDIVVVSGGKYYFYPVLDDVAKNDWSTDDFVLGEDGRLSYAGSGEARMQTGVTVSSEDGSIDWTSVSEDDIGFVMLDAGGRLTVDSGEEEAGTISADDMIQENAEGASAEGLSVGAMWALGAVSEEEALEEAETLVELLSEVKSCITMPVAVCVNVPSENDRTAEQGRADWTACVTVFCTALEEAGYQPMIYGNLASFVMMLDLEELESTGWARWISNSGATLYFPYEFSLWEYSSTGTVQGIATEVRLSAYFS